MRLVNYVGRDLRILKVDGDGVVRLIRYCPSCGQAKVRSEIISGALMDGVPSGILKAEVTGLPDWDSDVVAIVRQDVANAVLRNAEGLVLPLLIPYDPVLVPKEHCFKPILRATEYELVNGTLGGAQAKSLLAMGYVCYGYRRLIALEHGGADTYKLIFPCAALMQWPTRKERAEEFKEVFVAQRTRVTSLRCSLAAAEASAVLRLSNGEEQCFDFDDDGLNCFMLKLDELEQRCSVR